MYMRLFQMRVLPEAEEALRDFYEQEAIPELENTEGCLSAQLVRGSRRPDMYISMTLWIDKEHGEAYENGPVYKRLTDEIAPFLSGSSDWQLRLSEDLELSYDPMEAQPRVTSYKVKAQKDLKNGLRPEARMCTRILSQKVMAGMGEEFDEIYRSEIIPALQKTEGCLYAALMERIRHYGEDTGRENREMISITIWENREAADQYENSGEFDRLLQKVKHTFSQLTRWSMSMKQEEGAKIKTSADTMVEHYTIITEAQFG